MSFSAPDVSPPSNNLREFRLKAELSQEDLSRLARIAKNTMSRFERGVIPSPLSAHKIANALGVSVDEIWPGLES